MSLGAVRNRLDSTQAMAEIRSLGRLAKSSGVGVRHLAGMQKIQLLTPIGFACDKEGREC